MAGNATHGKPIQPVFTLCRSSGVIAAAAAEQHVIARPQLNLDKLEPFVDALPIGAPLPWSRIAQLAYDASPQVANVTAVLLNGATADLTPPPSGVIKAAPVTVN